VPNRAPSEDLRELRHRSGEETQENKMEAPPLERKLVAILAADVAGYSRLMESDEEGTLATLSTFRAVTDDLISRHGGRICGTAGDSILAAFGSALAAVQCAVDIQGELAQANAALEKDRRMRFRIGINVGDVMVKEGDIFGDGVNIAARLEGLAEPGGICISRGIHDHVMKKLPFEFEDLGEKSVKNIAQPIRVFRLISIGQKLEIQPTIESLEPLSEVDADIPSFSDGDQVAVTSDSQAVEIEFWDSIKNSLNASEYEAYLEQYPEGSFAALARVRLEAISKDAVGMRDPQDREVELSFWESVRESDNPALIRAYLEKYPNGEFRALAEIRLGEQSPEET
jgi:adenylate cyclase